MKILCVIDYLGSGGAQRQLVNLAIGFKHHGHDVSFLVYHQHNFYREMLAQNNIDIHEIIDPNYFYRFLKIRQFIRKGRFDAVLSFLEAANFLCEMSGFPKKNWSLIVGERSSNPNMFRSLKSILFKYSHFFADFVVANSFTNINMVKKINPFLPSRKCKVIYNYVDFNKWRPAKNHIPMQNGKLRLVVLASHRYLKNLNGLVEATNLLSDNEKAKLEIHWYGDEHDNSKAEGLVKIKLYNLEKNFNFYPATLDVHSMVRNADVVGLFSFYEGLPNTICEGMSAGKVVISSHVSDIKSIVNDDKLVFDPSNPAEIAQVLSRVIHLNPNEIEEIGVQNNKRAQLLFNNDSIINEYLMLLSSGR